MVVHQLHMVVHELHMVAHEVHTVAHEVHTVVHGLQLGLFVLCNVKIIDWLIYIQIIVAD